MPFIKCSALAHWNENALCGILQKSEMHFKPDWHFRNTHAYIHSGSQTHIPQNPPRLNTKHTKVHTGRLTFSVTFDPWALTSGMCGLASVAPCTLPLFCPHSGTEAVTRTLNLYPWPITYIYSCQKETINRITQSDTDRCGSTQTY